MSTRVAGDAFGFTRDVPAAGFPEGWRDLDRAVWRWVRAHGGDSLVAEMAGWASHAEGQGHTALRLLPEGADAARTWSPAEIEALATDPFVAVPGITEGVRPFVLDAGHAYLQRNHCAECEVASAVASRRAPTSAPVRPVTDEDLRVLFNGSWTDEEARQRDAVRQAPGRRLMVLTGGPGTGKTTTVLRMLLALSREHLAARGALPVIRIAAPTGKAAQRLGESLRHGALRLREGAAPLDEEWNSHLAGLALAESGTVHRLLGRRGRHGQAHLRDERLSADIVVVDEASMLDLGLLNALLGALSDNAVLVLVGDADQLTSVGTGSVMLDIVQALEASPQGDLVRLEHCFRADATLVPINAAVRGGDEAAFDAAWQRAEALGRAARHHVPDAAHLHRLLRGWAQRVHVELARVDIMRPVDAGDGEALTSRLGVLRSQQLLCALREGPFGSIEAGAIIARHLRGWDALQPWDGDWYPGRCVMVTHNDPAAGLYNGDVGVCVPVHDGHGGAILQVLFDAVPDATGLGPARLFDPTTLPPHEDAFALTVHKSQGSEYDHVAVLLPPDADNPLLTRQTLYTGLSRAKSSVELWSVDAPTRRALATAVSRHGRLAERITEGAAFSPQPGPTATR